MVMPFAGETRRLIMVDEINTLAEAGEHPAIELPLEDGVHLDEVDEKPDPAVLKTEIEALEERKVKAKREAGYWQRKEAEARDEYRRPDPPAPIAEATAAEPQEDNFDNYTDFIRAQSAWTADQRVAAAKKEWDTKAADKESAKGKAERDAALKTKMDEGFSRYDDFEEVTFDRTATHITPMVVDILADCDNPADVAYHLAKNRVDGVRISRMTPTMAAREMMKIDQGFGDKKPSPKTTTSAPAPIKPVGSGESHTGKDPNNMSQAEFTEYRNKQGAKPF
jgi:hypothetical protein